MEHFTSKKDSAAGVERLPSEGDQIRDEDEFRPVSHRRAEVEALDKPDINDISEFDICLTKKTSSDERVENLFNRQA